MESSYLWSLMSRSTFWTKKYNWRSPHSAPATFLFYHNAQSGGWAGLFPLIESLPEMVQFAYVY